MSAFRKIISCVMMASFLVAITPRSSDAQFLAFAPNEIANGIKQFLTDIKNSKVVVFAVQSADKIKGALGDFNAAMASFLANNLMARLQDVKRAKCKFDQKKKKLKCSSAAQKYKKIKNAVETGKDIIDRGKQLVEDSKQLIATADSKMSIIKELQTILSEVNRLSAELKQAKADYKRLAENAVSDLSPQELLKREAETLEAETKIELGEKMIARAEIEFIAKGEALIADGKAIKGNELIDEGEIQIREGEALIDEGLRIKEKYAARDDDKSADKEAMKRRMDQIGNDLCELYNRVFEGNDLQKAEQAARDPKAPTSSACVLEDTDIGATIMQKVNSIKNDAEKLYDEAKAKVKEGEKLLKDAKNLVKRKDCRAGQDPKKDNCYKSEDAEYCKTGPEDESDYCDLTYPKIETNKP